MAFGYGHVHMTAAQRDQPDLSVDTEVRKDLCMSFQEMIEESHSWRMEVAEWSNIVGMTAEHTHPDGRKGRWALATMYCSAGQDLGCIPHFVEDSSVVHHPPSRKDYCSSRDPSGARLAEVVPLLWCCWFVMKWWWEGLGQRSH